MPVNVIFIDYNELFLIVPFQLYSVLIMVYVCCNYVYY